MTQIVFNQEVHPKNNIVIEFKETHPYRLTDYLLFFNIVRKSKNKDAYEVLGEVLSSLEETLDLLQRNNVIQHIYSCDVFGHIKHEGYTFNSAAYNELIQDQLNHTETNKLYSVNELTKLLSVSRPTIYSMIKDGRLKAVKFNDTYRVKNKDLQGYLNTLN